MGLTETYNEQFLLQKTAAGDERAFRALFDYWQPLFSNYIFSITKSKELTAELVQDVFLKVWLQREELHKIEHFKAYLFSVSRNHALNALRKAMRQIQLLNDWEKLQHESGDEMFAGTNPLHDKLDLVDEAINRLTNRQRQVYQMHRHEKLTYQQIADQLGIGKESVKTHLEIALKSIRKHLNDRTALLLLFIEEISRKI